MSWVVQWNGKDYEVDPGEFSGMELKLVKERTGLSYRALVDGITEQDGEAICALFWIAARRGDPDLKYSDFEGPPLRLVLANINGFVDAVAELGKVMKLEATNETPGTPSSPSGSPDASSDASTTA